MEIYELRKIASNNKKYKYVYQLVVKGETIVQRRSNKDYCGIWIEGAPKLGRYHWFQAPGFSTVLVKLPPGAVTALAITFEELVKHQNLTV